MKNTGKYKILYDLGSKKEDLKNIPLSIQKVIKKAIEQKLTVDPLSFGKPLRYSLNGHRRLRVGDWRVIYRVEQKEVIVIIVDIDHRKKIYE